MGDMTPNLTPETLPVQKTRAELATDAREHYERVSMQAADWLSTIPQAIDAWERQPALESQLAAYRKRPEAFSWLERMTPGEIAAELSATFDIGLGVTNAIALWMKSPAALAAGEEKT